jgi:hypothetical protein
VCGIDTGFGDRLRRIRQQWRLDASANPQKFGAVGFDVFGTSGDGFDAGLADLIHRGTRFA